MTAQIVSASIVIIIFLALDQLTSAASFKCVGQRFLAATGGRDALGLRARIRRSPRASRPGGR